MNNVAVTRENILVIRHGAFGDVIQCDGALRDIRAHHRGAHVAMLTGPAFRALMQRCPHVDEVLVDARRPYFDLAATWRVFRLLRGGRFSKVYDLQKSDRTWIYRRLVLPRVPWSGGKLPESTPYSAIEGYRRQFEAEGVATVHTLTPDVNWMADDMGALLRAQGVRDPYVALIPGSAARHPHKRWPHYAALARGLLAAGHDVVMAPGPDERELARSIPGHVLTGDASDASYLDWFQLAGVLARAAFVVGNDTGPSHLAACLGVPGLALFGPHTSARKTGIRRARFDALEVPDLAALRAEEVLARVLERIAVDSGPPRDTPRARTP